MTRDIGVIHADLGARMRPETKGLTLCYGGSQILHGIDFTAEAGEVTCILGPNGVGKTSVFKADAEAHSRSKGSIALDAECLAHSAHTPSPARGCRPTRRLAWPGSPVVKTCILQAVAGPGFRSGGKITPSETLGKARQQDLTHRGLSVFSDGSPDPVTRDTGVIHVYLGRG